MAIRTDGPPVRSLAIHRIPTSSLFQEPSFVELVPSLAVFATVPRIMQFLPLLPLLPRFQSFRHTWIDTTFSLALFAAGAQVPMSATFCSNRHSPSFASEPAELAERKSGHNAEAAELTMTQHTETMLISAQAV